MKQKRIIKDVIFFIRFSVWNNMNETEFCKFCFLLSPFHQQTYPFNIKGLFFSK